MGVKDVQFISDKQWLAGIRDIIELHKYGRADEVRTVHRLASTCEERYQKALEYLEGKRGQQGEPAGARGGRRERGQQGKPAGASGKEGGRTAGGTCWSKQGGKEGERTASPPTEPTTSGWSKQGGKEGGRTAGGTGWRKGRKEDSRGNLLEQARGEEGERTAGETCWRKGRKEDSRENLLAQAGERKREDGRGNLLEQAGGRRTAGKTCWRKGGGGRREDGRGNLLEQGKEGGRQGEPAGAREGEEGERTAGGLGFHDLWLRRRWSRSEILK